MAVPQQNEFNDPALKNAVCRCWAGECASTALRKRVAALLEQESPGTRSLGNRRNPFAWMIWPAALAAMLLISFGLFNRFHGSATAAAIALPVGLENNLIHTHDRCCRMRNHQGIPVSRSDDTAIVKCLNQELHQPVVMYHPTDPAWVFRGASVCRVGDTPTGHLVFAKGDGSLSIFSLPKSTMPGAAEGSQYAAVVDRHSIVGFVKDGALFCMVSSGATGSLSIDDLKQMESNMQPETIAAAPANPSDKILLTELLQPVSR